MSKATKSSTPVTAANAGAGSIEGMDEAGEPGGKRPSALLVVLALVAVQVCFGANYVVSKVVVTSFPPLVWGGIRLAVSTAVFTSICLLFRRQRRPAMDRNFLLPLIGLALLGTVLNQASFLVGLRLTTASNSAVLNTLIPVATLILVTLRGQENLNAKKIVGFFFALFGVLAIRRLEDVRFTDATFIGDLLNILNCVLYAMFLSYSKPFMVKYDSLWVSAFLFLYGTVGMNLIAAPSWAGFTPPEMTPTMIGIASFAILFGTLIPYFLNFWALKHAKPSQVALFIYIQPIVTAAFAYLWQGEVVTARTAVSSVLIFTGMLVALSGSYERKVP